MIKKYKHITIKKDVTMNYIVYYPLNYSENLPLLLFLHGIGERGNVVEDVEKYALPKYMNIFNIPYIVVCPQCSNNNFWDFHLRDVEVILEKVYKKYKYDKQRVCILGCSMGSYGAWDYIISRPNLFKGIVSVSGGMFLPIKDTISKIKNKNILIYHGEIDDIIDVNKSIETYNKLKENGATNIELKIIKNDNHYLSSHAFEDKYIYEWLDKNC